MKIYPSRLTCILFQSRLLYCQSRLICFQSRPICLQSRLISHQARTRHAAQCQGDSGKFARPKQLVCTYPGEFSVRFRRPPGRPASSGHVRPRCFGGANFSRIALALRGAPGSSLMGNQPGLKESVRPEKKSVRTELISVG